MQKHELDLIKIF